MSPEALRIWIDAHRYTVSGLADALGVSRATMHRWLAGTTSIPAMVERALRDLEREEAAEG